MPLYILLHSNLSIELLYRSLLLYLYFSKYIGLLGSCDCLLFLNEAAPYFYNLYNIIPTTIINKEEMQNKIVEGCNSKNNFNFSVSSMYELSD